MVWQVVIAVLLVSALAAPFSQDQDKSRRSASDTEETTTSSRETTTTEAASGTTAAPVATTRPQDPTKAVQDSLLKAIGKSNRKGVDRLVVQSANPGLDVVVTWAINENLSDGITKDGSRLETMKMLKWFKENYKGDYQGVRLEGTYSLQDRFGNATEDRVFLGTYSKATVRRINYDSVSFKTLWELTDTTPFIHPAFRY